MLSLRVYCHLFRLFREYQRDGDMSWRKDIADSLTRFYEIGQFFEGLFTFWHNFEPYLETFLCHGAKFCWLLTAKYLSNNSDICSHWHLETLNLWKIFAIELCIIGETFVITSSPILGAFYNNEKNYFVYCYSLLLYRLFLNNVKVESFV